MSDEGNTPGGNGRVGAEDEETQRFDPVEYETMLVLERLESLEEDMVELGVSTLDEVRRRIAALHRQLDEEDKG